MFRLLKHISKVDNKKGFKMKKSKAIITLVIFSSICFLLFNASVCNAAIPKSVRAKSEYVLAEKKFQTKAYSDALKHLDNARKLLGKSNSKIQYLLIKSYYELAAYDKAKEEMDLFFNITPESESSSAQYNEIVVLISEIEEQFLKQEKEKAPEYFELGLTYRRQKNYKQALVYINKAMELIPNSIEFNRTISWIYSSCPDKTYRDGPKAIEFAQKAVNIKKSSSNLSALGSAYQENKQYNKQIDMYKEMIALWPNKYNGYSYLAEVYATCPSKTYRDGAKAVELALKAVSLRKNYFTLIKLANAYSANKQYGKQIETLEEIIEIAPEYVFPYNWLAWLLATCEDTKYRNGSKAVEMALKSLSINESNAQLDTLAAAYVENKEFEKAIQTYTESADKEQKRLKKYQKSLKEKGFYSGEIDGVSSPQFIDGMRKCVMQGMYL
jgi:tetratricopeptide (TPR) repeat protein